MRGFFNCLALSHALCAVCKDLCPKREAQSAEPKVKSWLTIWCFLLFLTTSFSSHAWRDSFRVALKNGGALVQNGGGRILFEHRTNEPFIPASTIKVAMVAAALHHMGRDFRFSTEFYLTPDGRLAVRGLGDPSLTSEEFPKIVNGLKAAGVRKITGILLDDTYFSDGIEIDGAGKSSDPYNALNGALIANFNTVHVRKLKNGQVISAETQTPVTPTAVARGKQFGAGKFRVNLGTKREWGTRYFGELLREFLKQGGITVLGEIQLVPVPGGARQVYVHRSSQTLADVSKGLLKFSTNFMSNQLFLTLGARVNGAPATTLKAVSVLKNFLHDVVGWRDFSIADGAGLSRQNRVSPKQMMRLLDHFEPNRDLLPAHFGAIHSKTGTLSGVNTLVGYFDDSEGEVVKFVILVNDAVPYDYKFQLARKLYQGVTGKAVPDPKP